MIIILLLCLLSSVFCEILIDHGDKRKFMTTVQEIDKNILVLIQQDLVPARSSETNEDTGVEVQFVGPSVNLEEETIGQYHITIGRDGKNYVFRYATTNETTRDETGEQMKDSSGIESLQVKGTYSYKSPGGFTYIQGYTADKNGFRTKVSFGKNVLITGYAVASEVVEPGVVAEPKNIDPALLCSLVGGGCTK